MKIKSIAGQAFAASIRYTRLGKPKTSSGTMGAFSVQPRTIAGDDDPTATAPSPAPRFAYGGQYMDLSRYLNNSLRSTGYIDREVW